MNKYNALRAVWLLTLGLGHNTLDGGHVDAPWIICDTCGGNDRQGCTCPGVVALAKGRALAKRTRKNLARLDAVARGGMLRVEKVYA